MTRSEATGVLARFWRERLEPAGAKNGVLEEVRKSALAAATVEELHAIKDAIEIVLPGSHAPVIQKRIDERTRAPRSHTVTFWRDWTLGIVVSFGVLVLLELFR